MTQAQVDRIWLAYEDYRWSITRIARLFGHSRRAVALLIASGRRTAADPAAAGRIGGGNRSQDVRAARARIEAEMAAEPAPERVRPVSPEIDRLRARGWSVTAIARHLARPEPEVAAALGVQWGAAPVAGGQPKALARTGRAA